MIQLRQISLLLLFFFSAHPVHASIWDWLFKNEDLAAQETPPKQDAAVIYEDSGWSPERLEFLTRYSEEREFRPPNFAKQNPKNYDAQSFAVPTGMEKQVAFWLDIYTRYSTGQGVVHDTENLELVYQVVDFSEIESRTDINKFRKEHLRQKLVENEKIRIAQVLRRIHEEIVKPRYFFQTLKFEDPEENRIYQLVTQFKKDQNFLELAESNRVRFQLGQRDRMKEAIFLSGRYMEEIEKIFAEENLPLELGRIAFVESSFNVLARSKVGASGIWQIMPTSVRKSAIKLTYDLRNHPFEATKAAAKLMKFNYHVLKSWPLAVTAYNHGPTGMKKLVTTYQNEDLPYLIKNAKSRRAFGFASKNFYACFLAVLEAEKNALIYFPQVTWSTPLEMKSLKLTRGMKYKKILDFFEKDERKMQLFNPHITAAARKRNLTVPAGTEIFIPNQKRIPVIRSAGKNR